MSIRFDAAADRLLRTSDLPNYNAAWTAMAWVYLVSDLNAYGVFFALNSNSPSLNYDLIGVDADGTTLVSIVVNGVGGFQIQPAGALSVGTWAHVCMSRTSTSNAQMYLNGVASGTANTTDVSGRSTGVTRMEMGAATSGDGSPVSARVFAPKVWTAALSAAEIAQEVNIIRPNRFADLHLWSPLVGDASDITDYSGFGRNWSAGGTLTVEDNPPVSW